MTRRRWPVRTAFFAALLVLAQLFAFAHESAVRHVQCAAHGELVETTDAGATSVYSQDAQLVAAGDHASAAEHEHCAVASSLHSAASPARAAVSMPAPPPAVATAAAPTLVEHALESPYRFAPKTSPPVA